MEFRLLDPATDSSLLRDFLTASDPEDYLLEELPEWVREGRLWAGIESGTMVSFARLHDLGEGEGWVSGMRVVPSRRRTGLGRQLLEQVERDAQALGLTALRAVIEDGNVASRGLFTGQGFRSVAELTLRRGLAGTGRGAALVRADPGTPLGGPVEWVAGSTGRVDLLPGSDGGRFGRWRPALVDRWLRERKLYVGPEVVVAVQPDWWRSPRTLWANPLRGEPGTLVSTLTRLTRSLDHEEWQAFLPSTDALREEYDRMGLLRHPFWGDRLQLYEWVPSARTNATAGEPRTTGKASP